MKISTTSSLSKSLLFQGFSILTFPYSLIKRITAYAPCARALIRYKGFSVDCSEIFDTLDRIARRSSIIEKDDRDALQKWYNREIIMLEIIDNISKLGEESAREFINPSDTKNTFYHTLNRILKVKSIFLKSLSNPLFFPSETM